MTSASTFSEKEPVPSQNADLEQSPIDAPSPTAGLEALPEQLPTGLEVETILHGQEPADDEVIIILSQLALKQVATHSYSDVEREVGGALLGHAYHADGHIYLDIRAAIPAVTADHGPVHFTFTADAWSQLHKDRAVRYPELDIVGWFHTHPDLGVFYSSDDVVVHSAAFTMPWHVGMVVDPVRKETSFFGWKGESLVPYPGFYERLELEPVSLLQWQPVPTAVWDHSYEHYESQQVGPSSVYLSANSPMVMPALKTYIGYGLAALGLALSLIMLFAWVMPLTREVDRLQNMVVVLADTALADSNAALCPDPRLRILSPLVGQSVAGGTQVEIMGTAMIPDASRYMIDARPAGTEARWANIDMLRGSTKLGELATWDTESFPPGVYELRIVPVDSNSIRLPGSPDCAIGVELAP